MELIKARTGIELKFLDLCTQVARQLDLEIYDLEYKPGQGVLRIFVQNPDTKSAVIEDCVKIDHALTEHIEQLEWMPEELTLEVSSPGMFRDLTEKRHFEAVVGEMIEVVLSKSLDELASEDCPKSLKGQKKMRVKLAGVGSENVQFEIEDKNIDISLTIIKKAKLSPPWN